jgi:hypothetical protein
VAEELARGGGGVALAFSKLTSCSPEGTGAAGLPPSWARDGDGVVSTGEGELKRLGEVCGILREE